MAEIDLDNQPVLMCKKDVLTLSNHNIRYGLRSGKNIYFDWSSSNPDCTQRTANVKHNFELRAEHPTSPIFL